MRPRDRRLLKRVVACTVFAVLARTGCVAAQDAKVYVGGAFMTSTQGSSTPGGAADLPKPGVGGSAVGVVGTVGRFLSPRVSVSAEISVPNRFEVLQELRYSFSSQTDNRHRDLVVSSLFHIHGPREHTVHPELVMGLSYVREDTLQRTAYQVGPAFPPTGVYGPFGPETSITRDALGLTVGADVGVHVSSHVSIVPQARLHWISRTDLNGSNSALLFLGPLVFRAAVGLRATF
jgi:hypothetical protein